MPGFFSSYAAANEEDAKQFTRRSEKARAVREYAEANAAAGIDTDPAELDRIRMTMVGNDPFLASMVPPSEALNQLTKNANEKAQNFRMKTQTERWAMQDTKRNYVQRIVDDNWDKSPEDMGKIFESAFGPEEAPKIFDEYKPQLSNMLSEATGKQYAKIKSNPASQYLVEPEDIDRLFPAEARSPATRRVLESIRTDNVRARNKSNYKDTMDVLKDTPDFVASSPEGQAAWFGTAAQGLGLDNASQLPENFRAMQGVALTQAQAIQQTKVTQLAAKDPYFTMAAQNGDEDAIFAATTSLMVQAGMPAPKDKTDPSYLSVKKSLEMVSRTSAVNEYNKREADLKTAAISEAEAIEKGQKSYMDAAGQAVFFGKEFTNGKTGKDAVVDPRLSAALSLVNNDPSFFGTPENAQAAVAFMRDLYLKDKGSFDPNAAYGQFMAEGNYETKAGWIQRRTDSQIQGNGLLKPGTNFRAQIDNRKTQITSAVNTAFAALNKPAASTQEYETIMNNKAVIVQRLRAQMTDIRTSINTLNNDPAVRNNVTGFDYQSSLRDLEVLENSIQQIEKFNPVPPTLQRQIDTTRESLNNTKQVLDDVSSRMNGSQPPATVTTVTPLSYESVSAPPTNAPRSRMDSYLDAVADIESNGDPFARAATSTAKGIYQFTKGTWNTLVARHGERFGITEQDIWNPNAQRVMARLLTMENGNHLMRLTGKEPAEKDLYMAHFLGPSRAATVINNQGSNLLAANLFPDAAKANKGVFYKDGVPLTIEELYKKMGDKMNREAREPKSKAKRTKVTEIRYNQNGEVEG